jgi:PAS domain S-box-containing protein
VAEELRPPSVAGVDVAGVLAGLPDGVLITDRGGRVLYANRQAAQLTGYDEEELCHLRVEDLLPVDLRAGHQGHRDSYALRPHPRRMGSGLDLELRRRNGSLLPVDIALSPLPGVDELLVVAAIRDDSGKRSTDRALRDHGRFLEVAHDAFLVRRWGDGRITFWNQGAERTYGYSRPEAVGAVSDELLGTVYPESRQATDQALEHYGEWEGELAHRGSDGGEILVESRQVLVRDERGRPATIFEVNRDVTQQRRSRDRLAAVLDVSSAILSRNDDGAGLPQRIARHARRLMGAQAALVALVEGRGRLAVAGLDVEGSHEMASPPDVEVKELAEVVNRKEPAVLEQFQLEVGEGAFKGRLAAVPLAVGDQCLGAVAVMGGDVIPVESHQLDSLAPFAAAVAVAIDYARTREELRQLAVVQDRQRIAHDLHDTVIRSVFGVAMSLQGAASQTDDPDLKGRLESSVAELDDAISSLRAFVFGLRRENGTEGEETDS